MKKTLSKILFVIGFLIFLLPFIMRGIEYFNQTKVIYNYKTNIANSSEEDINQKKEESNEYNETIADQEVEIRIGEEIEQKETINTFNFLKTGKVIGTLLIPSINANLPIYDGIDGYNLEKGVARLTETSYPTGKPSTHSVIVGHSGLTRVKILDDIDKLQIGDNFQIEYLDEITNYEVIDIKIVLPNETDSLKIVNGETLVTLVTCTPKGINSHRLLVTGKKVDMPEEKQVTINQNYYESIKRYYVMIILILVIIIILVFIVLIIRKKTKMVKK